ncbi:MAG: hypothetical protein R3D63_06505 [Paracoccaceae bacterium]
MKEAALVAALAALLFGSVLYGLSLSCTGALAALSEGANARQALIAVLRQSLTHPMDLLPYALPVFLGILALLLAVGRLRHLPLLAVALGLFPFAAMTIGLYVLSSRVCNAGPDALILAQLSGGLFAALAALIHLAARRRA